MFYRKQDRCSDAWGRIPLTLRMAVQKRSVNHSIFPYKEFCRDLAVYPAMCNWGLNHRLQNGPRGFLYRQVLTVSLLRASK